MNLQAQYLTALLMGGAGAVLGMVYDIYRTAMAQWRFLRRFSPVFDLGFWVFAVILVFTLLLGTSDGDVRLVVFVLLGLGYTIYRMTLHKIVVGSTKLIVWVIQQILFGFFRVVGFFVIQPMIWALHLLLTILRWVDRVLAGLESLITWPMVWLDWAGRNVGRWIVSWWRKYVSAWWRRKKENWKVSSNKYWRKVLGWFRRPPDDHDEM